MRRYLLHLAVERSEEYACAYDEHNAVLDLGTVEGVVIDSSTGKSPPYDGWNLLFGDLTHFFIGYNFIRDITDQINAGPLNPGEIVTIASKWSDLGALWLNCFGKICSRNHPEESKRPSIDIYEVEETVELPYWAWWAPKEKPIGEGYVTTRFPIGDTYFQSDMMLDPKVGLEPFLHVWDKYHGTPRERIYRNIGMSFDLSDMPVPPPPVPPPIPPEQRIGIRGM